MLPLPPDNVSKPSFFSKPRLSQNDEQLEDRRNHSRLGRRVIKILLFIFLFCVITVGGLYVIGVREQSLVVVGPSEEVIRSLSTTARLLHTSDVDSVRVQLDQNNETLLNTRELLENDPRRLLFGVTDIALPLISNSGDLIKTLLKLNGDFLLLFGIVGDISRNGFHYLAQDSNSLITLLEQGENTARRIVELSGSIKNITRDLKRFDSSITALDTIVGESYLSQSSEIGSVADTFLSVRELLKEQRDVHMLILFEDDRTLIPGGGVISAYGDVVIRDGELRDLTIREAGNAGDAMSELVEPPFPIDALASTWELKHALWSPNFESSALSAKYLLEHGKRYSDANISFDAVISVSRATLGAIVDAVGPISIGGRGNSTITGNKIITEGISGAELEVLSPTARSLLDTLSETSATTLIDKLGAESARGGIRFWTPNIQLKTFLKEIGVGGGLYITKGSDFESYMGLTITRAPANAKVEPYTGTIAFTLDSNGDVGVDVSLLDTVLARDGVEHIQLITSANAQLISSNGNVREGNVEGHSYAPLVYAIAPELETYIASQAFLSNFTARKGTLWGKEIFEVTRRSNGSRAPVISMRYHTPNIATKSVAVGDTFTFVFETPPGLNCTCAVTATAPFGFIWQESGTATVSMNMNGSTLAVKTVTLLTQ